MTDTVVRIDFYFKSNISDRILAELKAGRFEPNPMAIIAVSTIIDALAVPHIRYKAENIGTHPEDVINYFRRLALEDGIDLSKAFTNGEIGRPPSRVEALWR